ncbi:hypothetical protein BWI97_07210 [Siphonobacter sp. BAB-5405]|uniref:hypothetical protein n=1 Tax=Siphonobacter sp. BAB-5405 TaxID=1864825 RepID=UPI000C80391C|nr:hypothetical protein [Siphonobacter sp. BAB-5405]PMD97411.1 hypothetical protein BWI97_07210 [Siphonobacter sp. BAB-5405]
MVTTLSKTTGYVGNSTHAAIVTLVGRQDQAFTQSRSFYQASSALYPDHFPWGPNDAKPNEMHKLMSENDKALQFMATKVKFLSGSGVGVFEKQVVDNKVQHIPFYDPELEDWLESEVLEYVKAAAWQWVFSWGAFIEQHLEQRRTTKGLGIWATLKTRDLFECRIARGKNDQANGFALCDSFGSYHSRMAKKVPVPAFNKFQPDALPFSIQFVREPIPGQPYYPFAGWWGGNKVMTLANLIPEFHINGIRNGYNIKYLIKIPADYFDYLDSEDAKDAAFLALQNQLDTWLSGVKNVNKALLTRYMIDPQSGKPIPGVIIEPMKNEMNDDAFEKIAGYADRSAAASQGLLPVMAGIEMGSSSGGSGSQIRLAYDYEIIKNAPDRGPLLRPVRTAARINFPEKFQKRNLDFQIIDTQMTTLDQQHGGTKKVSAPID